MASNTQSGATNSKAADTAKKQNMEKRIQELEVLQSELGNMKKGARVYQQQQNSNVMFLADKNTVFSKAKQELDSLVKEYKEAEVLGLENKDGGESNLE